MVIASEKNRETRAMRKIVVAVALLFAVSSQSQQTKSVAHPDPVAAPAPLVEKIDVSVVNIDVSVTDRTGQPVSGLTRNDFEILEDGRRRRSRIFISSKTRAFGRRRRTPTTARRRGNSASAARCSFWSTT
jgi:uncharacterized lipoprotein YajG